MSNESATIETAPNENNKTVAEYVFAIISLILLLLPFSYSLVKQIPYIIKGGKSLFPNYKQITNSQKYFIGDFPGLILLLSFTIFGIPSSYIITQGLGFKGIQMSIK